MIKVAITGNIASGKSQAEKIISNLGYKVLNTDCVTHDLLEDNLLVINTFRDFDILSDGKISREKLGKLVFSSNEMKTKLERILHPQIKDEIEKFFNNNSKEKVVFVSVPLLFEAKMDNLFDKIILIYSDDEIRLSRLIKRNNYSEEYAKIRMISQQPQEEKVKKADFVIYNNSSVKNFENEILTCLQKLF